MPPELPLTIRLSILVPCFILRTLQYFAINRRVTKNRRRRHWSTRLDTFIPFVPQSAIVCLSTYAYGLLPFLLIKDTRLFLATVYGYLIITAVSRIIYVTFPSEVNRVQDLNPDSLSTILLAHFQRYCRPYDCFPSTHVAYSVVVVGAAFLNWGSWLGGLFLFWALLISASTLTTKQHYVADVVTCGALGLAVFLIIMRLA